MMGSKNEIRCCFGCGRDTASGSGFCSECAGLGRFRRIASYSNRHTQLEHADRHNLAKRPKGIYLPIEDDYSEEAS